MKILLLLLVHVVIDCDQSITQNALNLFAALKSASNTELNIITVPRQNRALKPAIFTRNFDQMVEALEHYTCYINVDDTSQSQSLYATVTKILPQMRQGDSILVFVAFNDRVNEQISSQLLDKLLQKEISVNVAVPSNTDAPSEYEKLVKSTGGDILTYTPRKVQFVDSPFQMKIKPDTRPQIHAEPNYQIHTTKKQLYRDTRTQFTLPENTFQIFLTMYGEIEKALLVSSSGIIINVLPIDDEYSTTGNNRSVNFDLIISKSPAIWTLSATGGNYNVTFMRLTNTQQKYQPQLSGNYEPDTEAQMEKRTRSVDSPVAIKQRNPINPTFEKRFDALEPVPPGPFFDGQPNINAGDALGYSPINGLPTIIDVDLQSTFYVLPGEVATVVIHVKNNKPIPSSYQFRCFYPQQLCVVASPTAILLPQQSITVVLRIRAEGSEGSSNVITFVSRDVEIVYRKIYLYIGRQRSDTTKPDIDYEYNGNCDDATSGNTCHRKRWSAEVVARDTESGLLSFWSEPPGLLYTIEFIVGTRDSVSARYSASCCEPKVDIFASDLKGNTYKRTLNVEHQYLNWVEITAIVLGAILLFFIIAMAIYLIIRWRKKKSERSFLNN